MGLVEQELQDVSKRCEQLIPGSRLVACVRSMVRVEIKCTSTKTIVVCAQFPVNYPQEVLLIELKSKTLSSQLLDNLTAVCEREARKTIGGHQILAVLKFVRSFLEQNPLSCCYDEVKQLKQDVASAQCGADELHLKQKTSTIVLRITQGPYFLRTVINVPDLYPEHPVSVKLLSNTERSNQASLKNIATWMLMCGF